jgi:ATP-dependent RNA helicase DeaD
MTAVKAGEVRFLAATDVAARGIDISNLTHVFNYSLPNDPDVYLHRTGRTGRIGKEGTAISLMNATAMSTRKVLVNKFEIPFIERELPSKEEAVAKRVNNQAALLKAALGSTVFESFLPTVKALLERPDGHALIAVALRAFFRKDRIARARPTVAAPNNDRNERRDSRGGRGDSQRGRGRDDGRGRGRNEGRGRGRDEGRGRGRDDGRGRGRDDEHRAKGGNKPRNNPPKQANKSGGEDLDSLLSFD